MDGTPKQQPLNEPASPGKATPDPNTDFGDEAFDYTAIPQKRISAGGLNEWIFGLMRPKSKVSAKTSVKPIKLQSEPLKAHQPSLEAPAPVQEGSRSFNIPAGYAVENGLLIQRKSLAERVRDQIKYPVLKSSKSIINGVALVMFAVGAYILYSELPTRPELVVGILIVAISANLIISNR